MTGIPELSRADWLAEYPPPRSLPLDQEALRIYEHAYYIGLKNEEEGAPPVSFSTVMAALLVGEDETGRWLAQLDSKNGQNAEAVYSKKGVDEETVRKRSVPAVKLESGK